ncbi:lysophospholipid acyltransferase family protein [Hyalangium rubrum]|uniref:Lysophospholipid acyltransferase family protein n=1 Tax=Hyalangium rubrum TaxID=3103134 RepID=A0ABU5H835_9BACT|nr:lysophospholipid acyltransferase family protein [Hyalangium sp. s54d21]MDY7228250.1 lysophospholipid acyltransferase family protein [Hyalangium sp. s54d21]
MSQAHGVPLSTWLAAFRLLRAWHRYEVKGLGTLLRPGAKLIVAYHGRPLALDQCMLTVTLYERLGYLPHGIIHGYFGHNRLLRWVIDGLGFVTGDGQGVADAVARGEHILVQPGGTREGCRSFRHRYQVDWGERLGYLRLAIKYGLPIVPVAGEGVDDGYLGLNDGYALGRRLGVPFGLPVWLGIGATGVWPFSPPLPVKMTQWVGEPIERHLNGRIDPGDREALLRLHQEVRGAVQALMDGARSRGEGR